jgi:hypothetical protein
MINVDDLESGAIYIDLQTNELFLCLLVAGYQIKWFDFQQQTVYLSLYDQESILLRKLEVD